MRPLVSLLRMRASALRNHLFKMKRDSAAKVLVVLAGLGNVLAIGLWISYRSLEFIEGFRAFGPDLNSKMISLLFFVLLVLIILSTIIIAYMTLFVAGETRFFFQHPISPRSILFVKLTEAISFSSWASLFLCLPVLVSFGLLRNAPTLYYIEATIVLVVFLLFAGLVGAAATLALAPVVKRLTPRRVVAGGILLLAALAWVFLESFELLDMDGENSFLILDRFTSTFTVIHSPYSPSYWASSSILAASAGNHREVCFQGSLLLANTLIFLPFLSLYGTRFYGRQWVVRQGAGWSGRRRRRSATGHRLARGPVSALLLKDILIFIRDPSQLSQSVLFLVLVVIYSLSLIQIPDYMITGKLERFIYFSNLGAICMILSSFTSRFLFPLLSLEGRAFWILGLAPMPRRRLLGQKLLLGLGISLVLGLLAAAVSSLSLRSTPLSFASAVYTMVLAAVCLSALATGLGAAYPRFDEDNPARIAVSLGGTLNFFASALSVALLIFLQAVPYLAFAGSPPTWALAGAHLMALGFTITVSSLVLRLGGRALARSEF